MMKRIIIYGLSAIAPLLSVAQITQSNTLLFLMNDMACPVFKETGKLIPWSDENHDGSSVIKSDENLADSLWAINQGVENNKWYGFKVYESRIDESHIWVVPAKGKPWGMWIQDFWDGFHRQINEKLLNAGVCVVTINSYNTYGGDYGLNLMDSLYNMVRHQLGLSEKSALTGTFRTGLSVYRWVIRHPEHIVCIYCAGSVLDFKRWPMSWSSSVNNWAELKRFYGFSNDEETVAYKGNPIDNLEPIAKAKIPIRHVISLTNEHDTKNVPNKKNTLKTQKYLNQMGYDMEVVVTPKGMKSPYVFDDESVEFMILNVAPTKSGLDVCNVI